MPDAKRRKLDKEWSAIREYIKKNAPQLWDENLQITWDTIVMER